MSEAYEDAPPEEPDVEEDQEVEEEEDQPSEEDEEEAQPKPVDWEKRAHSHAGQAARERSRRQAAERKSQDLEARLQRLEGNRRPGGDDELLELIANLPDDEDDPITDIAAVKRALKLIRHRELGGREAYAQQERAVRETNDLKTAMADTEAEFANEHPDYHEAATFYRNARAVELRDMGYQGDELMTRLANELFGMVRTAFNTGMDPAERVYELARKRGYKTGQKAADRKLDAFDKAGASSVRPQARSAPGVLSWGDVAKLDGAARDKAWEALRKREKARK